MIIFDDNEYVNLLVAGNAPKCIFQNSILRSCAKVIKHDGRDFDELYDAICKYTDFQIEPEKLQMYVDQRTMSPPVRFHAVEFGLDELRNIYRLPRNSDRKYYLAQLFLFKYFGTKRMRLSGREFKRVAGLPLVHYPLTKIKTGKYISTRREDSKGNKLQEYTTNKPYTYYYPKGSKGTVVFSYEYKGDCFMLPNLEWDSNIGDLWALCEEARGNCLQ